MIFVIDDDRIMAKCIVSYVREETLVFANAIDAMDKIAEGIIPKMIFLDILLDGPDGFTFLNELVSYNDTAKIPVVIVTSLDINKNSLATYGVVGMLNKEIMRPEDIRGYAEQYSK